jgi:hypothetical protein
VPEQQHDLDDLFLLVAHGVDFLTDKENSKWEEEGGYEFHPWNRPQSSFAVRQAAKAAAASNKKNTLPAEFTEQPSAEVANESSEDLETASAAIAMSLLSSSDENKPMSPPLTPQTSTEQQEEEQNQESLAKRVLGSEKSSVAAQPVVENQALDDDVSVLFFFFYFWYFMFIVLIIIIILGITTYCCISYCVFLKFMHKYKIKPNKKEKKRKSPFVNDCSFTSSGMFINKNIYIY